MVSWAGKKVFVTGAGGFIGSHLCEALVKEGADVTALVHYRSDGRYGWLEGLPLLPEMHVVAGDVRDASSLLASMSRTPFDVVFHLAALISIPYSYQSPHAFLEANARGTLNMLDATGVRAAGRFVHTSTSEVYGNGIKWWMDESHPLHPQSPYAASKVAADAMVTAYYHSFSLPVVTLRPFNCFGPRQSQRALVPSVILQALSGGDIYIAHPESQRDWTYIDDTINAFLLTGLADGVDGELFNIGTGKSRSVVEVARTICESIGAGLKVIVDPARERPHSSEVTYLCADSIKAKERLMWEPKYTLEGGLVETIRWFRDNRHLYPMPGQFTI